MRDISKTKATTVTGIDCSTNSIAFCRMLNGAPINWGEINIAGANIYDKIYDARKKVEAMRDDIASDYIVVESAIMVRSPDVAIKLAYISGSIIGELLDENKIVKSVAPITWQSAIGNKNFTAAEKQRLRDEVPGKSYAWYKTKMRSIRKQRTIDWVYDTYRISLVSDNVADAFGLAYYVDKELTV